MKKDFDCVEMKRQAQAEHRREAGELGEEEAKRRQRKRVLDDPILGDIARKRWPELEPCKSEPERIVSGDGDL